PAWAGGAAFAARPERAVRASLLVCFAPVGAKQLLSRLANLNETGAARGGRVVARQAFGRAGGSGAKDGATDRGRYRASSARASNRKRLATERSTGAFHLRDARALSAGMKRRATRDMRFARNIKNHALTPVCVECATLAVPLNAAI
ncbi:MAG: hypothetical protein ABTQ27_16860, partial [Amaricoccus sp.]